MKRKRYTPESKSQIVIEVLKEEKTMNEIASSHGIHVNLTFFNKKLIVTLIY